ncbi:Lsr2 family protein [Rothia sp. AR01]|uniref:Lsr2 family protein n=1 Tax=Rothia santali TaxID=2949643 RepID=A0A9X2HKR6_9MICC|nr:Lsr2 family protein [Rothia santali]MCP3426723.1 Lsr2 family protein [Rothia santali]
MAQKVKIILEDDLEGGVADETVRFGLDGGQFEIDLSSDNAAKLRDAIRPYAAKARRVQTRSARSGSGKAASTSGQARNPETAMIRQWAKENGYNVSDRGRIHQEVQDAYYKAQKKAS